MAAIIRAPWARVIHRVTICDAASDLLSALLSTLVALIRAAGVNLHACCAFNDTRFWSSCNASEWLGSSPSSRWQRQCLYVIFPNYATSIARCVR
jgi:hypothetical protein